MVFGIVGGWSGDRSVWDSVDIIFLVIFSIGCLEMRLVTGTVGEGGSTHFRKVIDKRGFELLSLGKLWK